MQILQFLNETNRLIPGQMSRDEFDISLQEGGSGQYARKSGRNKLEEAFAGWADSLFGGTDSPPDGLLKYIDCPVCQSSGFEFCFRKYHMDIGQCSSCGFVYTNPIISSEIYDSLHLESTILSEHHVDFIQSPMYKHFSSLRYQYELQLLKSICPKESPTLLDIGCSTGGFVEIADKMGFDAVGIEANKEAARIGQMQGLNVIHGMFGKTELPRASYDIIVCLDVLEHVENPRSFLSDIRHVMHQDSLLLMQVPNVLSLIVLLEKEQNQIYNGLIHLNYFSPFDLSGLAKLAGFETIHAETVLSELGKVRNYSMSEIADCLQAYDFSCPARITADWINDNLLGYKILAVFR